MQQAETYSSILKSSSQLDGTCPSAFARLPVEIVLEIFWFASCSSSQTARAVSLVASWTLPVARESLYRTVVLLTSHQYNSFIRALGSDKELVGTANMLYNKLRNYVSLSKVGNKTCYDNGSRKLVSNIWLPRLTGAPYHIRAESTASLFAACTQLRRVAIPGFFLRKLLRSRPCTQDETVAKISELTLTSEAFRYDWDEFTNTASGRSFLRNLTHLWVLSVSSHYLPLKFLSNLTHLAIPLRPVDSQRTGMLDDHSRTRLFLVSDEYLSHGQITMLVYYVSKKELRYLENYMGVRGIGSFEVLELAKVANSYDHRVYVVDLEKRDACGLWESSARSHGSEGIWTYAQQFLGRC